MELIDQFVVTMLRSSTPIILAAVAGLFAIRAGVFHLGMEGLMLAGAFTAVAVGTVAGSVWIGLAAAIVVCLVLSVLYWILIDKFRADTVIAGLGLTALCVGGTAFLMQAIFNQRGSMQSSVRLPRPVSGVNDGLLAFVSELSVMTWVLPILVVLGWILLTRSHLGLQIAAVGEYPYGAEASGVNQSRVRLHAILITGVGCALAGAQLSVGDLSAFTENMTNGRGFIALAAMLFGARSPLYTALAGLFFGFADAFGILIQIRADGSIPRQFVLMAPFVITIVIVALSSSIGRRRRRF
ncbi:MAG: ABC transporter permease [Rhodobacteraceae bacterium]|nr:ABC transporter permease [Paracoccaceae bacterium]